MECCDVGWSSRQRTRRWLLVIRVLATCGRVMENAFAWVCEFGSTNTLSSVCLWINATNVDGLGNTNATRTPPLSYFAHLSLALSHHFHHRKAMHSLSLIVAIMNHLIFKKNYLHTQLQGRKWALPHHASAIAVAAVVVVIKPKLQLLSEKKH